MGDSGEVHLNIMYLTEDNKTFGTLYVVYLQRIIFLKGVIHKVSQGSYPINKLTDTSRKTWRSYVNTIPI